MSLDAINTKIANQLQELRLALLNKADATPLVGDQVIWPNGTVRRISHELKHGYQTSLVGSYFAYSNGEAGFSGSLKPAALTEFFVKTEKIESDRFWFFSHGLAGAGRGVDCQLPVRVWQLKPFKRSRGEALRHPLAMAYASLWGAESVDHERMVQEIMNPQPT